MKKQGNNNLMILSIIGTLFFVIGFALGINGLLIPYLQKAFDLSSADAYWILTATFGSFAVFGYPAGFLIKKIGYKYSMAFSFFLFAIGLYLYIPSAKEASFYMFLIASFVSGMGNTLLQAVINPYVTICGPIESATTRISIMGILNKSGWAVAPVFLSLFLDLNQSQINLLQMYLPFYIIVSVFVLLGIFTYFIQLPEVNAVGEIEDEANSEEDQRVIAFVANKKSVLQFPHLILGLITLFLYVGTETIVLASPVDYAVAVGMSDPQIYTSYTVLAMVIGYLAGVFMIPKIISQHLALKISVISGIVYAVLAILVPSKYAIYFIALMGLSNALIWGPVWPLALSYLGKYTKQGASLLVSAIVGGAVLPLLFGWLTDWFGDIQQAYVICIFSYMFMVYYAFWGYKAGLKKIIKSK